MGLAVGHSIIIRKIYCNDTIRRARYPGARIALHASVTSRHKQSSVNNHRVPVPPAMNQFVCRL